jgi:hypothetical protein
LKSEVERWRERALRAEESERNRGDGGGIRRREQPGNKRDRDRSPNRESSGRGSEPASRKGNSPARDKPRNSRSQSSDLTGEGASVSGGKGGGEGERPKGETGPDWRTYAERRPAYLLNLKTIVREPSDELVASRKKTAEDKARISERFRAEIEAYDEKEREKELAEHAERERAGQEKRIRARAEAVRLEDSDDDQEPMVLTQAQGGAHATRTEKAWDDEVSNDEDWNVGKRSNRTA